MDEQSWLTFMLNHPCAFIASRLTYAPELQCIDAMYRFDVYAEWLLYGGYMEAASLSAI